MRIGIGSSLCTYKAREITKLFTCGFLYSAIKNRTPEQNGEMLERASQKYNNIICTGDFNAKSQFWFNVENNAAGNVLENFMLNLTSFVLMMEHQPEEMSQV